MYCEEAEKSLLGILMVDDRSLVYTMSVLKPKDFHVPANKYIFEAINTVYKEGLDVDIVTVSNQLSKDNKLELVGGRAYVNDLATEVACTSNYKSYIKLILEESKLRNFVSLGNEIAKLDSKDDIDDAIVKFTSQATNILTRSDEEEIAHVAEGALEVYNDIERAIESGEQMGLSTSFNSLDKSLGGLIGGKFYILAGRPSMGKTALALNIAEAVARDPDKNVLVLSLEMQKKELSKRIMMRYANVNSTMINNGMVDTSSLSKLSESLCYVSELNLFIEDRTPCTPSKVELAIINMINNKGSCDLVVIDYLQLMDNDGRKTSDSRQGDVSEISRKLKRLANKYNVPIVCLSQLSRAVETRDDKHPKLSDLRESGAIEQDADVVMFVYRGEYYDRDDISLKGLAEIIIAKQRDGACGTLPFAFNSNRCEFKEMRSYDYRTS